MAVDEGLAIFRERNTDVSLVNGKSFGEVIDELVWTGDEMGLAASDGKLRAVGDKTIEKHEKRTRDSRLSVFFYRTGSVAGALRWGGRAKRPRRYPPSGSDAQAGLHRLLSRETRRAAGFDHRHNGRRLQFSMWWCSRPKRRTWRWWARW